MQEMNKVMDPQKTAAMMQNFQKESMKMDMTEEMSMFLYLRIQGAFILELKATCITLLLIPYY